MNVLRVVYFLSGVLV